MFRKIVIPPKPTLEELYWYYRGTHSLTASKAYQTKSVRVTKTIYKEDSTSG